MKRFSPLNEVQEFVVESHLALDYSKRKNIK